MKREREDIPENNIASLQEELAASKLREAESNLALKDLRSKVADLNTMWQKHLKVTNRICSFQFSFHQDRRELSKAKRGTRKVFNEKKEFDILR